MLTKSLVRFFASLLLLAEALACSQSENGESLRQAHQYSTETEVTIARIAGFENQGDWQPTNGTEGQSILHTEGDFSLSVNAGGWTEVKSVPFPALGPVGDHLSFDFFKTEPAAWGDVRVVLRSSTLNWYWKDVGQPIALSQLDAGQWLTLQFSLDSISAAERVTLSTASDLAVSIIINAPSDTFYLDNLDFDRPEPEPSGTGGGSGSGGGTGSGGTPPVDQNLITNQEIFGFERTEWAGRGAFVESQPYVFQETSGSLTFSSLAASSLFSVVPREGESALVVTVPGATGQLVTASFITPTLTNLDEVSDTVGFDIKIPSSAFGGGTSQYVKVMVNAPSIGIYNDWVGQAQLNGGLLYSGQFMRAQFPLPPHIKQKLESGTPYSDLRFQFILENVTPGDYGFDYFALREQFPPVVPPAPSKDADDILGFDNIAGWLVTGAEGVQLGSQGENGASLCLSDFTYATVKSANLSTLSALKDTMSLNVFLPHGLGVEETLGINTFISIPSMGHYRVHVGYVGLNGAESPSPFSQFMIFSIPSQLEADLREGIYGDLSIEFELQLPRRLGGDVCLDAIDVGQERFSDVGKGEVVARHFDVELPPGVSLDEVGVYARDVISVAETTFEASSPEGVPNDQGTLPRSTIVSNQGIGLGSSTTAGDLYGNGLVVLRESADVGDVYTPTTAIVETSTVGSVHENHSFQPMRLLRWRMEAPLPGPGAEDVVTSDGQPFIELEPGVYGNLSVRWGHTVAFRPGRYSFRSFGVEDGGTVWAAGATVFIHGQLHVIGAVNNDSHGAIPQPSTFGWLVQVPNTDYNRNRPYGYYGASQPSAGIMGRISGMHVFSGYMQILLGGRIEGKLFSFAAVNSQENAQFLNLSGSTYPGRCLSCEFTFGCADATVLDADGDGLSNCEEQADRSGWTSESVPNGVMTTLFLGPPHNILNTYEGADFMSRAQVGANEFQGESVPFNAATLVREFQFHLWDRHEGGRARLQHFLPGWPEEVSQSDARTFVSRQQLSEAYFYAESRGHHCFRLREIGPSSQWLYVGTTFALSRTGDEDAVGCVELPAGGHRILYGSTAVTGGGSELLYCYGGNGECEPREYEDYLLTSSLRPTYNGEEVPCVEGATTCTELCPCDDASAPCGDGNACTIDVCNYPNPGQHHYFEVDPDDGNHCTVDSCDQLLGVINQLPETGNVCTYFDCDPLDPDSGTEVIYTSAPVSDGNACTIDYCDADGQEQHDVIQTTSDPCVLSASCDPASGVIGNVVYQPEGASCGNGRTCRGTSSLRRCLLHGQTVPELDPGKTAITIPDLVAEIDDVNQSAPECPLIVTIPEEKAAFVSGIVGVSHGQGEYDLLPGAQISVLDACEYGYVTTKEDGTFRLPLEGGGKRVIQVRHPSYLSSDRVIEIAWGEAATVGLVLLVPESSMDLPYTQGVDQMLVGEPFTLPDENGNHVTVGTPSLFVPADATIGGKQQGNITITPYTTGLGGPYQMPAELPPNTDYTHAFEVKLDGEDADIEGHVIYYYDNRPPEVPCESVDRDEPSNLARTLVGAESTGTGTCADFAEGMPVPNFYYNRDTGRWEREGDGTIIRLVCDGSGQLQSIAGIEPSEISQEEFTALSAQIGDSRSCGDELWRVELEHFSPRDFNWLSRMGYLRFSLASHDPPDGTAGTSICKNGSYIELESGKLGERISLSGMQQSLHFNSDAMFGYAVTRQPPAAVFQIGSLPYWEASGIAAYDAGRFFSPWTELEGPPPAWVGTEDTWSGRDVTGRRMLGTFDALVGGRLPYRLGCGSNFCPPTIWVGPFTLPSEFTVHDASTRGFGGWTLSGHHAYDGRKLYRGDTGLAGGNQASRFNLNSVHRSADLGGTSFHMDRSFFRIEVTRSGGVFLKQLVSPHDYVRFVAPSGAISPVGDPIGPLGTFALDEVTERLFIADTVNRRILATQPSSRWTGGVPGTPSEIVNLAPLAMNPLAIAVTADGTVVVAVRKDEIGANELTLQAFELDLREEDGVLRGQLAASPLFEWHWTSLTVALANGFGVLMRGVPGQRDALVVGSYMPLANQELHRMFKWSRENGVEPILWNGETTLRDAIQTNKLASETHLSNFEVLRDILPLADGTILFSIGHGNDSGAPHRLIALVPEQSESGTVYRLRRWAGTNDPSATNTCGQNASTSGPTIEACLGRYGMGLAVGPDGYVWMNNPNTNTNGTQHYPNINRLIPAVKLGDGESALTSEDGSEQFVFDSQNRHRRTVDPLDPSVEYLSFHYDDPLRPFLPTSFTERGLTTQIERTPDGSSVTLTSAFLHKTVVSINTSTGYAESIARMPVGGPNDTIFVAHNPDGLLTRMEDGDGVHVYEYDPESGRLIGDIFEPNTPHEEKQELAHTRFLTNSHRIDHTNGVGELTTAEYVHDPDATRRITAQADGTGFELQTDGLRTTTQTLTDGTAVMTEWELSSATGARIPSRSTINLPKGGQLVSTRVEEKPSTDVTVDISAIISGSQTLATILQTNAATNTRVVTSPMGRTITVKYDNLGRITEAQAGNLSPQVMNFFEPTEAQKGQLRSVTWAGQETPLAEFDYTAEGQPGGAGYVKSVVTPDTTTTFARDGYGRLTTSSIGTFDTHMSYDWDGRLASVTEPDQSRHDMTYGHHGQLTSYEPPMASSDQDKTLWVYDNARRVAEAHLPGGAQSMFFHRDGTSQAHPSRLRRVDLIDGNIEEALHYVYGDEAYPPPNPSQENPEPLGKPGQVHSIRRGGLRTQYTWNGPLQTKEEVVAVPTGVHTTALEWIHDGFLRVGGRKLTVAGTERGTAWFDYNDDSQLSEVTFGNETLYFHYDEEDGHGLLEGMNVGDLSETITHDNFGRTAAYTVEKDGFELYSMTVDERDALGRITKQTISRNDGMDTENVDYSHDLRGQLESVTRDGVRTEYKYDANGNRRCSHPTTATDCASSWTYNADNELLSADGVTYTYDPAGRLATRGAAMGAMEEFDYDILGSLREVSTVNAQSVTTKRVLYTNDQAGRRIRKRVLNEAGNVTEQKQYVWANALQIEAELDANGNVTSRFVYGLKVNVPELIVRGGSTYRVVTDHLGSPVLVYNVDNEADVLLEASYNEWGEPYDVNINNGPFQGESTAGWPIPFGFAGGLFDEETRLVRFGARDYDPSIGRWTAKDPILFAGGQTNLYVYVGNDPVNFQDVSGEIPTVVIGAGLGALAGAGAVWLRGGDTQAIIAGAIGGAVGGAIAGTGLGFGFAGGLAQQSFAAGFGGLIGDFANLRPGMEPVTLGEVGGRFATRAAFGAAGGLFFGWMTPLYAGGTAGAFNRRLNDVVVGGACNMESDFLTE